MVLDSGKQHDIDKVYLYARDLNEPKYEILIEKRKDAEIKHGNLLNVQIRWMTFMKIFMIIIQTEEEKF